MADGKMAHGPDSLDWVSKSHLHVLTGMSTPLVKRTMDENEHNIPTRQKNAKTKLYKSSFALELLYKKKFNIHIDQGDEPVCQQEQLGQMIDEKQARARLAIEQTRTAEIKNEIMTRKLIKAEELESHWSDIILKVRAKVLSMPSILATRCAGIEDKKILEKEAKKIAYEALEELSVDLMPEIEYETIE